MSNAFPNRVSALACSRCGTHQPVASQIDSKGCPDCYEQAPSNFEAAYSENDIASRHWPVSQKIGNLWRFDKYLPIDKAHSVSLNEGGTPLCAAPIMGSKVGVPNLYIKDESRNPTWSYKDRFSSVVVSYARLVGAQVLATSSSGNAGASLAAYAAKAGLPCIVLTFADAAGPMLAQIRKYGAMVLPLQDKADRWPVLSEGVHRLGWFATSPFSSPVVGSHPVGIEGYKTVAYETFEQLGGKVPDWFVLPVAYGDGISGIWRGFKDLKQAGLCTTLPRLAAAEIYGSLTQTLSSDLDRLLNVNPSFETTGISIGSSQSSYQALKALRESNGAATAVSNSELIQAQQELASTEGLLGELSSVAPFATIQHLRDSGTIQPDETVVSLLTASGLKDLDCSTDPNTEYPIVSGDMGSALQYLSEHYHFHMQEMVREHRR